MYFAENERAVDLIETLDESKTPCLSLYQPTHRHHPENVQDPIRFHNLVRQLDLSLRQRFSAQEAEVLLAPFIRLAEDHAFWQHTRDGLAVLGGPDSFHVFRLQGSVPELAIVADSFHTKPLLRLRQSSDRYQILAIDRHTVRLFEGNRYVLDEITPSPAVPRTMPEALGSQRSEPQLVVASYGGTGASHGAMHHGHGGKAAEVDLDAERFFRLVDRQITEHHSKPSGLPLMLATLSEHRRMFHSISHNPQLLEQGIDHHPDTMTLDVLRQHAWVAYEPIYLSRIREVVERFGSARARGLADDDLAAIAVAIIAGRVETLLVESDRVLPGRIDTITGAVSFSSLSAPDTDDVLDDMAALAAKMGARVMVVPADSTPGSDGVAAIFRF